MTFTFFFFFFTKSEVYESFLKGYLKYKRETVALNNRWFSHFILQFRE